MGNGANEWLPQDFVAQAAAAEPADTEEWSVGPIERSPGSPPAGRSDRRNAGADLDRLTYEDLRARGLERRECVRFLSLRERGRGFAELSAASLVKLGLASEPNTLRG